MPGKKLVFRLENIKKTYPSENKAALNIKELKLYSGQVTVLLGQSGAGKSTLLNMLGLLDKPDNDSGDIYYERGGKSFSYKSLKHRYRIVIRRRDFGFIFQSGHLLSHMNSKNNIAIPLALNGVARSERLKIAKQMLHDAGLADKENSFPTELSGGEYQRVAVMRALAHTPSVIFADEPTGNLDPENAKKIMDILCKWQKEQHRTLILITHNEEFAYDYADHIITIYDGHILNSRDKRALKKQQKRKKFDERKL